MSVYSFVTEIFRPSNLKIAKYALGKYIVLAACVLHFLWAALLCIDIRAANATPLSILAVACDHSIAEMIAVLLCVSICGLVFLNYRIRRAINKVSLTLLLLPQQILLLASAGAGLYSAYRQHYADGTPMSWAHILADQTINVVVALLYSVAVIESLRPIKSYRTYDSCSV